MTAFQHRRKLFNRYFLNEGSFMELTPAMRSVQATPGVWHAVEIFTDRSACQRAREAWQTCRFDVEQESRFGEIVMFAKWSR